MTTLRAPSARTVDALPVVAGYDLLGERFVEPRDPTALPNPYLVAFDAEVADLIGLDPAQAANPRFLELASGNARFAGVRSYAAVYAGHQFGVYVPQLGDGRAITLGEVIAPDGERWEWQLKGAGMTAYSRFADGRAVLRSTVREYLCSEAMHALGIPTTRALAIAGSDQLVYRERPETAAVLSRIAPSHVRFGTFEFFHHRDQLAELKTLADYVIERFYPQFLQGGDERFGLLLREVVLRTARLIARWQAVGFQHGVLNTDNMSILGLTLDYGPYGFMEAYDPAWICNHSDPYGRYRFEMQPTIGLWNCRALAVALSSLVEKDAALEALAAYEPAYIDHLQALLHAKFGLAQNAPDDVELFTQCFRALQDARVDYTTFFRRLAEVAREATEEDDRIAELFADRAPWEAWLARYRGRLEREAGDDLARRGRMLAVNPKYVLRNYLAQNAIGAAECGDFGEIARLAAVLRRPFDEQPERDAYASLPPDWAAGLEVSCSS